ncbi:hypothetical protein BDV12DRAFT_203959 [Aspergillus spectabilis]
MPKLSRAPQPLDTSNGHALCPATGAVLEVKMNPVSLNLALPYIFGSLGENTLHVSGAVNLISIPIVWALYPESSQRTLEEIDLLFAAKAPWVWAAEANFARLMAENLNLGGARHGRPLVLDAEKGWDGADSEHEETVSSK